jgi:hypothetical protein
VKFFAIILSLYVLLLSARPCCADNDCADEIAPKKELADHKAPLEKHCEACSPFFKCGSCAGFILSKPISPVLIMAGKPIQSFAPYRQPNLNKITLAIWQPPQLS